MVESAASFECFTKLQAAERQLRVAIRLFFERRDLVAIHTLAAAAQEVLRDLGCPRGIKSIFKGSDLIRPEYKDELAHRFNEAQNFFKHADRDPDKELKFYYKTTKFYLLDAALLYNELTGRTLPEIAVLSDLLPLNHLKKSDDGNAESAVNIRSGTSTDMSACCQGQNNSRTSTSDAAR
jgi:hypothetical protein